MIGKKDKTGSAPPQGALNVIGEGTQIRGDLFSGGDIRLDGTVKGSVESKSRFVLGVTGKVEGDISAKNADISGEVIGNIQVQDILYLKASAKVKGDIQTNKLVVESGGSFNGQCLMNAGAKSKSSEMPDSAPKAVDASK
jgi:cytoskeletal protein CcmA (bactofilin family)